jgi:AcrR family transcriptional regulator
MQRSVLRDRILDRAELQLWEQGVRGMRVDDLARDIGISKRTLYEEIPSKEEMAREALARRIERTRAAIDKIANRKRNEVVQMREIAKLLAELYATARPAFWRDVESTKALRELVEAGREHGHAKLEAVVHSGIARGRFRDDVDPRLVRRVLLAAVESVVRPEQLSVEGLGVDRAYAAIVDLLLNGLEV